MHVETVSYDTAESVLLDQDAHLVQGVQFWDLGLGSRVEGVGFRVGVYSFFFFWVRVYVSRVQGLGFRV